MFHERAPRWPAKPPRIPQTPERGAFRQGVAADRPVSVRLQRRLFNRRLRRLAQGVYLSPELPVHGRLRLRKQRGAKTFENRAASGLEGALMKSRLRYWALTVVTELLAGPVPRYALLIEGPKGGRVRGQKNGAKPKVARKRSKRARTLDDERRILAASHSLGPGNARRHASVQGHAVARADVSGLCQLGRGVGAVD
jgi:hypothetical protein